MGDGKGPLWVPCVYVGAVVAKRELACTPHLGVLSHVGWCWWVHVSAGGGVELTGPWAWCCHVQGVDVEGRSVVVCAGCQRGLIYWVWRRVSGAFGCR